MARPPDNAPVPSRVLPGFVTRWLGSLRFPYLFLLAAGLFLVDLVVPDLIPFADEILLALGTLLLGRIRRGGRTR